MLDLLVGRYDEVFSDRRMRQLRAQGWYYAARLRLGDEDVEAEVTVFLRDTVEQFVLAPLDPRPRALGLLARASRGLFAEVRRW